MTYNVKAIMTYKVIHNTFVNKVQTQAICNCRITARAVIWSSSYFPNVSIFLLTALGGHPENIGTTLFQENVFNQISFDQIFRKLDLTQKRHVQNSGEKL